MWFGQVLGRLSIQCISRLIGELTIIRWSLGLAAASQVALLLAHAPAAALVAAFFVGVFLGPIWPTVVSCAGAARPEQSGSVIAVVVAGGSLGGAVFPSLVGVLANGVGMRAALWVCFVLLAADLTMFTRGRRARR
ncbi:MAG: hypothetical protein A2Z18_07995 [Armatimonadetes bacterium RBG_16_58_9]|nr:MAG: hypothetical protein A2Z18_07995 [Armatimonadetes bacterium RBG_16_58_9]